MRRFSKENEKDDKLENDMPEINEGTDLGITEDIDSKAEKTVVETSTTSRRRVFEIIQEDKKDYSRSRARHASKSLKKSKSRNSSKASKWFKKSLFVVGNIRFTRLVVSVTLFLIIVLASSTIVLATNDNIFTKPMPVENQELIKAKNTVYIDDGEEVIVYQAYFGTVSTILKNNDIVLGENDNVYPELDTAIYNRMQIKIDRAMEITVNTNDEQHTVVLYNGTVADVLAKANIDYDEDDIIEPSSEMKISNGMSITHNKVEVLVVTEEVEIEFETEYVDEPTILKGYWNVKQKGKDGLAEVTYEVTYLNGEEQSRKAILENMIKEPQNKIIMNGTGLSRSGDDSGDSEQMSVENPDDQITNPPIPGTTSTYVEKLVAHVTAYTHTGNTTATGTWPRSTRTLENPGTCAVVPGTFPYGSLLYVPGYGYCIAEDTGGFRHNPDRWNQIDLFMNTATECINWGRRREWTVYVIRYGY